MLRARKQGKNVNSLASFSSRPISHGVGMLGAEYKVDKHAADYTDAVEAKVVWTKRCIWCKSVGPVQERTGFGR